MDSILYWNEVALEANRVSHTNGMNEETGPPRSARALAIVHLAMYDAFAGTTNTPATLPMYSTVSPAPTGSSVDAAVGAAAHATLAFLFPSQRAYFDEQHAKAGISGNGVQAGHHYGIEVASAILADRKDDPTTSDAGYAGSVAAPAHRSDPDNPGQKYHAPFYGAKSKGFAFTMRHALGAPPQPGDAKYAAALRQVKAKGIAPELMGTLPAGAAARTAEETWIGLFWGYDGASGLGTPPRLYNQIVRKVAGAQGNTPAMNARLFAFVNVAMADAGILCWEQKYLYDLWRPVVGIREHETGVGLDGDPGWLPLGAPSTNAAFGTKNFTPPFPAYPSGHATFGAAALQITRLFYGVTTPGPDHLGVPVVSDEFNGVNKDNRGTVRPRQPRKFAGGLWDMILENGLSRVFLGVHWVFDAFAGNDDGTPNLNENIGGVKLGLDVAGDIFSNGGGLAPRHP